MSEQQLVPLCLISDVTEDLPVKAEIKGEEVAVFQVGEHYYVTQNLCTHGPGELAEGFVDGDEVECPFHQGKFSIITGKPTAAPCTVALRTWDALARDGQVYASTTPRSGGGEAA
ncbi:non-heme iron oxygenase ferredoxin subunit [Caulobacter sp. S45]|uniref:non-heme iron oxygenase ferredoxin subunit n=1 Tax=Caulobacter sp. S45 TaxID=1641861 RepID=UPI00131DD1A5|nr:non-heme iron oxygenase ferredoxin subunit [Caulobacter sp. S45]